MGTDIPYHHLEGLWCASVVQRPQKHCQGRLPQAVCKNVLSSPTSATSVACTHWHNHPNTHGTCGYLQQHEDLWHTITCTMVRPLRAPISPTQYEVFLVLVIWDHAFTDVQQWWNLTPGFRAFWNMLSIAFNKSSFAHGWLHSYFRQPCAHNIWY